MMNVMIDLETLDTQPGAVILSIGAVVFDARGSSDSFYTVVSRASCEMWGMTVSADTLAWWNRQSPEAREVLEQAQLDDAPQLIDALDVLRAFIPRDARIWSNGANFDQPLLDVAYNRIGQTVPWKYYHSRCYRTIVAMCPVERSFRPATVCAHNALEDAKWQAEHLIGVCSVLGLTL